MSNQKTRGKDQKTNKRIHTKISNITVMRNRNGDTTSMQISKPGKKYIQLRKRKGAIRTFPGRPFRVLGQQTNTTPPSGSVKTNHRSAYRQIYKVLPRGTSNKTSHFAGGGIRKIYADYSSLNARVRVGIHKLNTASPVSPSFFHFVYKLAPRVIHSRQTLRERPATLFKKYVLRLRTTNPLNTDSKTREKYMKVKCVVEYFNLLFYLTRSTGTSFLYHVQIRPRVVRNF